MKKSKLINKKTLAFLILIIVILLVNGILAFMTDVDSATNIFTIGDDINISISEAGWNHISGTTLWTRSEAFGIHPGAEIEKAPVINNDSNTTSAYVFAEIVVPCYDSDASGTVDTPLFSLNTIGNGWTLIDTSLVDTTDKTISYVYAYASEISSILTMTELMHNTSTTSVFESVTLNPSLTYPQAKTTSNTPNIIVNAYAIQTDSLSVNTPEGIYSLFFSN